MQSTGITREVDSLGRVVIPKEIRNNLELHEGTPVEFVLDGNIVGVRKFEIGCCFCEGKENLVDFYGKKVCQECLSKIPR